MANNERMTGEVTRMNPTIETYSNIAHEYDHPKNIESCWGRITLHSSDLLQLRASHTVIADVGCGTGRVLAELAARSGSDKQFIGVEPATNMRQLARERTSTYPTVRVVDGSFENLPIADHSVDYLYSILAFHWTTDLAKSVRELSRVLKTNGEMDLTFIGRHNGREFIQKTTPVFFRYMTPALMVEAASLRKQLTMSETATLFQTAFPQPSLSVQESYHTYYDTLEGHWAWWCRIEGQFIKIPAAVRSECDAAVKAAIATLATDKGIPYTVHLLHVRLRQT